MNEIAGRYDVSKKELAKGRKLAIGAVSAPLVLAGLPAALFLFLLFVFGSTPPVAATIFFLGIIVTILGLAIGLGISGYLAYRRTVWSREMRERIAADGIRAEEIDWFRHELKSSEKNALASLDRKDLLLADAYRETLASRLTATRIVRTSKRELLLAQRRKNKMRYSKSRNTEGFKRQIDDDINTIAGINDEAKIMLAEAEARLQMIEAAAARGTELADSELALKKLAARTRELPLALEAAKMDEAIRKEAIDEDGSEEER